MHENVVNWQFRLIFRVNKLATWPLVRLTAA